MDCKKCHAEIRDWERLCPVCQSDCGYPNVRAAQKPEELQALTERLRDAELAATARNCEKTLEQFREAVRASKAVRCLSLDQVKSLVSSDNQLHASFYQLVGMSARRPENTAVDKARLVADALLFSYYMDQISFAALSLDSRGVSSFGQCSVTLRDSSIRERSTVFERNSLRFCEEHGLGVAKSVPPGYRATWDQRDHLAAAKLEASLDPGMQRSDFPGVLLKSLPKEDFIEVHIYGPLHRRNIEHVIMRRPKKADRPLLRQIEKEFKSAGIDAIVEVEK
jgi:hypothetical protein